MAKKKTNKPAIGKQKYYTFLLYLVVLVLINLVGETLFFRVDLTANSLYSLSDASIEAVSTLNEPLTVNVFFTSNLPSPYNNIERYLRDLLEEYEVHSNNNLSYRFYNVSAGEEELEGGEEVEKNRKMAHSYGVYPGNIRAVEGDEFKVKRAYMGLAMIHGDIMEKIPLIDTTEGLEYKITSAIRKMNNKISALVNLPEKIKVKLVVSSSLAQIAPLVKLQGLEGLKPAVQEVVDKLNAKTYNQLQFVSIDPTMGEGTPVEMKRFERFGLQWREITTESGQVIPAGKAVVGIGMQYGDKTVERNLLSRQLALTATGPTEQYVITDIKEIETFINDNVDNLIDINEDVGFLSTHGTRLLTSDMPPQMQMMQQQPETLKKFNTMLTNEYSVKKVTLEEEYIPDSIDTLIIAGAKENFSDWELYLIDQFLMKGKSLAIFIDSFNEIQQNRRQGGFQQPVYLPINTGLQKLLNHYGLTVKKSYLLDENCYINRDRGGNEMPLYFVPVIKNEKINHSLSFMENINVFVALKASPLEADMEKIKKNNLTLTELFSSSDKSWEMSGRINLLPFMIQPPADEKEKAPKPLAYLLEGEFASYFADKPIPEKPKKEEPKEGEEDKKDEAAKKEAEKPVVEDSRFKDKKDTITRGKPGKIFLMGTSEVLTDNVLNAFKRNPMDEEEKSQNEVFITNVLDYLNQREDIAIMRSKDQSFNLLDDTSSFVHSVVKIINIGGLPALFILLGIMIYFRRTARKKRIQAMFND